MSIWICKNNNTVNVKKEVEDLLSSVGKIEYKDIIYVYSDDYSHGGLRLKYKYIVGLNLKLKREEELNNEVDLPYTILYNTRSSKNLIKLDEKAIKFIIDETNIHETPPVEIISEDNGKSDTNFEYKNILLKGVPGTGKSHLIDKTLINKELKLSTNDENVLRINVHSASSNADLMQGIGINTTTSHDIEYKEKQGLILDHIYEAILHPKQAFVLVLEEIQENSLNELIGDLIYLIEPSKRTNIAKYVLEGKDLKDVKEEYKDIKTLDNLITKIVSTPFTKSGGEAEFAHFVEIPSLVSTDIKKRKMIFPDNLYVFCTSNFREDKKVIEDNLLRRFDTIEIYPNYNDDIYEEPKVAKFLSSLNSKILSKMKDDEVHPDRFVIGHAIWRKVKDKKTFYKALLKVVVEFKDVKELEYDDYLKEILSKITDYPFGITKDEIKKESYKDLIEYLQNKSYDFLPENSTVETEETDANTEEEKSITTPENIDETNSNT
ncbi:AAA family ATPase [Sulfurovum sp. AR]|uniref:AAA family ATPase n=1 Tax=Sulfurovum sp. AR TaxID=1165841 RepID=UPI00025C4D45|nr:AAA family ATPase [Sulfurovum sp. AR]EIF51385.1 ATPase [Sulfurovum sp. AR]